MSPPPKRRRIDVPVTSQVDEDIAFENEANGGSNSDSELEFEDDSDLGAVEDDIELEITPGQTMVLGLQSGKSWAEVESKLYPVSYSGTCIKTIKKRQEEKKEHKKHVRQFNTSAYSCLSTIVNSTSLSSFGGRQSTTLESVVTSLWMGWIDRSWSGEG